MCYFQMTSGQCYPSLFFSVILHAKWNIYPTSTTSYLNPEDSNLINRPLTDYDDVLGHHDEGIIFAHTMALHINPVLWKVLDKCESWAFEHWLIAIHKSLGNNVRDVNDWASARPHYDDEWGHKLMSLTYRTYLFLSVIMSHYWWA